MTAAGNITGPRCGAPLKYLDYPGRDDYPFPVCWRPAGHPPGRHLSRWAYLRELGRQDGRKRGLRKMSVPGDRGES